MQENKTKIICTLGPASYDVNILKQLILSGMNVARFNFSHAQYDNSKQLLKTIRDLNQELNTHVATLLDTKGPEVRTHEFDGAVTITKDSLVRITTEEVLGNASLFSVTYPGFYDELNVGDVVNVDDGYLSLEIVEKDAQKKELVTKAKNTHVVKSRRGVNVPNVSLNIPFVSEKDRQDVIFASEQNYDYIAASFVRNAEDVLELRKILKEQNNDHIRIISKIENQEGVNNLDEIIELSDGIMVARGDLGIEVPGEMVPLYQTTIIEKCLEEGKTVVVATQMLESMQKNPRPTKAEISDVYNAVKEGSTATMLSGESASGEYPVEAVQFMHKINKQAEKAREDEFFAPLYEPESLQEYLLLSAAELSVRYPIKAILVNNWKDAESISKFHPSVPVLATVQDEKEANLLALSYGITPVLNQAELDRKIDTLTEDEDGEIIVVTEGKIEIK
ncbi:pyruvate kinase [Italian clover phyllody phytoplasma]|uniref:pyruvate kinase n=1 Tax=Italian clover phyllody phytoplasma TaxID=1196420 RepID=UPI000316E2B6|nr:pyruvate kinase [Italian clover phyllody phytoplasma]